MGQGSECQSHEELDFNCTELLIFFIFFLIGLVLKAFVYFILTFTLK